MRSLLRQVDRLLDEHGGAAISRITVEVGPLSGVEPLQIQTAFEQLRIDSRAAEATLQIEETRLEAVCSDCDHEFQIESYKFQCSMCHSHSVRVIRGDEFRLLSIDVTTSSAATCQE